MKASPLRIAALLLVGAAVAFWGAGSVPLALLSLASVAAAVALSGVARRILGVLLIAVGVAAAFNGPASDMHWLAIAGGGLVVVSGVLQVALGARMPKIGMGGQRTREHDPETDMWRALERGDDPTDDKAPGGPSSNE